MSKAAQPWRVDAGPETVHWGFFDAKLKPVLTVDSGDRVVMSSVSGTPDLLPPPPFTIPPALPAIHAANGPQRFFGHMCTGPVAMRGAKAGQVLQVDIEAIDLHYDWGYNVIRPLAGALPDDFPDYRAINIALDRTRMIGRLPWGQEIPFRPFFGVMAVAPPASWGTIQLRRHAAMAATWTTRNWSPARRFTCRCSPRARCSRSATDTARRATARSALLRSKPGSSAPSV